jgi:GDP-4-dehydro-6-deoxy-D-mannose reductase
MTDETDQQGTVLVTGVNGFVGTHLVRELANNNIKVIGIGRENTPSTEIASVLKDYHQADLTNIWPKTDTFISVLHLAGLADVGSSFNSPQKYIEVNSSIMTNLGEYCIDNNKKARIIAISSGAVYSSKANMPLIESSEVSFNSPYSVSKILLENQAAYYRSRGLDCVIVRPFNHIGPGQGAGFLIPDLLDQLNARGSVVKVGNLKTKRDYTDVRDVARAYRLLATAPKLDHELYNVCSGRAVAGDEILSLLQKLTGNKKPVEIDEDKIRPTDAEIIYGSFERLKNDTGWIPEIPLEQTLGDILSVIV